MKSFKVAILGNGRIAQAAAYYFKKYPFVNKVYFPLHDKEIKACDLLVGALGGGIAECGLGYALRYKKNLIDISDIDPPFYLQAKKRIEKSGITVIPGCGFSPGLVNFILGRELSSLNAVNAVEVKAGSLSRRKFFFPFLWCFEDLILEHHIPSWQIRAGEKKSFPHFAGYKKEKYFGIASESYFCASGFENILDAVKLKNFTCKVVRPYGFREFFQFLKNQGFLKKENLRVTKNILEGVKEDNFTLGEIKIFTKDKKIIWRIKSFSKKNETLNSMQKLTASIPAGIGKFILENRLKRAGLLFMEDLGKDEVVFRELIKEVRKDRISLQRQQ